MRAFTIKAKVWIYPGDAAWHFVSTGPKETKILRELRPTKRRGFGAVKVRCTIGTTTWDTSVFPTKDGPYLLPLKASVRAKEGIAQGDTVTISCTLL